MRSLRSLSRFHAFQYLGFFIGGVVPLSALLVWDNQTVAPIIDAQAVPTIIVLVLVLFCIGVFILVHGDDHSDSLIIATLFYAQAAVSILTLHFVVLYTGGPIVSVMALSYLYLPAVVGYTYGSGVQLIGASGALSISYVTNLFWPSQQRELLSPILISGGKWTRDDAGGSIYRYLENSSSGIDALSVLFVFVFVLQILATTKIAALPSISNKKAIEQKSDVTRE